MGVKQIVVALTGATGAIYFERTIRALLLGGHHVHLVASKYGLVTLRQETDFGRSSDDLEVWLAKKHASGETNRIERHAVSDQTSLLASGSARLHGMIIVPCTMKTVSAVAHGAASNLIERAADVALKERRPLVVVPREAPYNIIHLENMLKLARAGAAVLPASPAFYQHPQSFEDLGDFIAQRALALLGIETDLFEAWRGKESLSPPEDPGVP